MAILLAVLAGLGAFAIDVGFIEYSRSQLQAGADAAALAAADELPGTQAALDAIALRYATLNAHTGDTLEVTVEAGFWNVDTATFTPADLADSNAVRVAVKRPDTNLYFGALLGVSEVDISATATATRPQLFGSRFILDDEMIDTDVPSIQNLATTQGKTPDELLRARGFNAGKQYGDSNWTWEDNFLDLPSGATLSLPTGQGTSYENNDAGLFDIDNPGFLFNTYTSFMKFLMWSETGNDPSKWGTHESTISSRMDPLVGVAPVTDAGLYESYVDANYVHVSPVTYSDCSTLNMVDGVPQVNAKGLRRGLISFKIKDVGVDVDGGGSVLPELIVEIVDPATINPLELRPPGQEFRYGRLVQ
jgi:Flp pilus assembly protein TadG